MRKIDRLLFLFFIGLILVTGCSKEDIKITEYNKLVNSYSVSKSNIEDKVLTFEYLQNDELEITNKNGMIKIYNPNNLATVNIYFYYENIESNLVSKDFNSFYSDAYQDYEKLNIVNHEGWSVYYKTDFVTDYQMCLVLTEEDDDSMVYAAYIEVNQSPLQTDDMEFNTKEYVKSDDFIHLVETLKVVKNKSL